jgi:hypothetical protein
MRLSEIEEAKQTLNKCHEYIAEDISDSINRLITLTDIFLKTLEFRVGDQVNFLEDAYIARALGVEKPSTKDVGVITDIEFSLDGKYVYLVTFKLKEGDRYFIVGGHGLKKYEPPKKRKFKLQAVQGVDSYKNAFITLIDDVPMIIFNESQCTYFMESEDKPVNVDEKYKLPPIRFGRWVKVFID